MKIEQFFEIRAPIEQVWDALLDIERVAPCLPGATITGRDDDGTHHAELEIELGPTTAFYRGSVRIDGVDEAARTARLRAKGSDTGGQGGASATIVNRLSDIGGGTRVDVVTDFTITGRLATFGGAETIEDVSSRLLVEFATCLQSRLRAGDAAPATAPEEGAGAGLPTPEAAAAVASTGPEPAAALASASAELEPPPRAPAPAPPDPAPEPPPRAPAPAPPDPAPEPPAPRDAGPLVGGVVADGLRGTLRRTYLALAHRVGRPGR